MTLTYISVNQQRAARMTYSSQHIWFSSHTASHSCVKCVDISTMARFSPSHQTLSQSFKSLCLLKLHHCKVYLCGSAGFPSSIYSMPLEKPPDLRNYTGQYWPDRRSSHSIVRCTNLYGFVNELSPFYVPHLRSCSYISLPSPHQ